MSKLKKWYGGLNKTMLYGMAAGLIILVAASLGDLAIESDKYWDFMFFGVAGSFGAIAYVVYKKGKKDGEEK